MVLVLALALVLLVLVVVAVVVLMIRPWFSYPRRCSTEFSEFCGRLAAYYKYIQDPIYLCSPRRPPPVSRV